MDIWTPQKDLRWRKGIIRILLPGSVEVTMFKPIKVFLCLIFLLVTSSAAVAKLKVAVGVDYSDEKVRQELQEGMEARINSTERYSLTPPNGVDADLLLTINCLKVKVVVKVVLVACSSEVSYFPYQRQPINITVRAGGMISGSTDYIVTHLMNMFINGTTDDILQERKTILQKEVRDLCQERPSECKVPAKPNS